MWLVHLHIGARNESLPIHWLKLSGPARCLPLRKFIPNTLPSRQSATFIPTNTSFPAVGLQDSTNIRMPTKQLPPITVGGAEFADSTAKVLAAAFSDSIFLSYLLRAPESTSPAGHIPTDFLQAHFQKNVRGKLEQGAEIAIVGEGAAAAIW